MNKLIFIYGTMNCGKTAKVIQLIHSFKEQHKHILTIKPTIANRDSKTCFVTRSGEEYPADILEKPNDCDRFEIDVTDFLKKIESLDCVIIDEAQFMEPKDIQILDRKVSRYDVPILFFGLLKDFRNRLFPTSKYLIEHCDDLREMKSICRWCGRKATCVLRVHDGQPVYQGKEIEIGSNTYVPVCRYHYYHPKNLG